MGIRHEGSPTHLRGVPIQVLKIGRGSCLVRACGNPETGTPPGPKVWIDESWVGSHHNQVPEDVLAAGVPERRRPRGMSPVRVGIGAPVRETEKAVAVWATPDAPEEAPGLRVLVWFPKRFVKERRVPKSVWRDRIREVGMQEGWEGVSRIRVGEESGENPWRVTSVETGVEMDEPGPM